MGAQGSEMVRGRPMEGTNPGRVGVEPGGDYFAEEGATHYGMVFRLSH